MTRNTGRNVSIIRAVQVMPIAADWPEALVGVQFAENDRHSKPRTTVTADAAIAGAAPFQAVVMA